MWHASFVAPAGTSAPDDPAAWFRLAFVVDEAPIRATLAVTALGVVEPWLNGARVGDEVLAPGWTSYRHRIVVSTHDVTDRIHTGENVLGAVVGQGWARGRLADWDAPGSKFNLFADRAAVFAELELTYADRTVRVLSDDFRVTREGPLLADSIYDGEVYDARRELTGWCEPGYEDGTWAPAERVPVDLGRLVPRTFEPIRVVENLAPVAITTSPSGRTVVDVGQNISGWVRLRVEGPRGTTITLRHAEVLEHGEPAYAPLRSARATDSYTLRGGGVEEWEPRFTYHGFRYVEVEGWPGELAASDLTARVVHSDMPRLGHFTSSSDLLNRFHSNVVWSMRDNFVGLPTDCPQRDERLGWTGDIHAFAPTAAFLYDVRGVLGSWLDDLAAEQADRGFVPWVVPDCFAYDSSPTALWSDVAVGLPWALYRAYGDPAILERQYDSMVAFIRQVEGLLDADGLWSSGFQFGDWLDPDAPADRPTEGKTDPHLVAQAFFARMTRIMADTAGVLGRDADAATFTALAERVRAAFRAEYVTAHGRLVNESATAYALALSFELLDADQVERAGRHLAQIVAKDGFRIATGFAGTPLVMDALTRAGQVDTAYRMLLSTQSPSLLHPVTLGATTIWERWDSLLPDGTVNPSGMTSFNHYALGAVADWLHRIVAGLAPGEAGYRTLDVAPQPGPGLDHASARLETPHGPASAGWRREGDTVTVDVLVPEGCTARVVLPDHPEGVVLDVGAGEHSWTYAIPVVSAVELSMDSTLADVGADPDAWGRVRAALDTYLPGIPIDPTDPQAGSVTLAGLLGFIPGVPAGLEDALRAAVAGDETSS